MNREHHPAPCSLVCGRFLYHGFPMLSATPTHTSARVLEFDSLRDLLRGYTASELGAARVRDLVPSADPDWIHGQHDLTSAIREFLRVGGRFEFTGLLNITQLI